MALTETRSAGAGPSPNLKQESDAPKHAKAKRRKPKAAKPKKSKSKSKKQTAKSSTKEPRCFHVYRVDYTVNGSPDSILVLGEMPAHGAAHLRSYNESAVVTGVSEVAQDIKIPTSVPASQKPKLIKAEARPKAPKP